MTSVDSPAPATGNLLAPDGVALPHSAAMTQPLGPAAILREFPRYLMRPAVLRPSGLRAPGAVSALIAMIGLYLVVQLLLMLPFLKYWQAAFELPSPDAFGRVDPRYLPWLVVLVAPFLEELIFRGWQRGTPRALWLLACTIAGGGALYFVMHGLPALTAGAILVGAVIAALVGWFVLRRRIEPLGWFVRAYPAIFHVVVIVFALSHLTNYAAFSLLTVPMVLPQAWGALLLGFVRQRIGLPGSILAHAIVNGAVLGVTHLGF